MCFETNRRMFYVGRDREATLVSVLNMVADTRDDYLWPLHVRVKNHVISAESLLRPEPNYHRQVTIGDLASTDEEPVSAGQTSGPGLGD